MAECGLRWCQDRTGGVCLAVDMRANRGGCRLQQGSRGPRRGSGRPVSRAGTWHTHGRAPPGDAVGGGRRGGSILRVRVLAGGCSEGSDCSACSPSSACSRRTARTFVPDTEVAGDMGTCTLSAQGVQAIMGVWVSLQVWAIPTGQQGHGCFVINPRSPLHNMVAGPTGTDSRNTRSLSWPSASPPSPPA